MNPETADISGEGMVVLAMYAIHVSYPAQQNKPRLPGHGSEQAGKPF